MSKLTYVLVALSAAFGAAMHVQERIVGGSEGDISMFPYQAIISYSGRFHCGGAIIGPTTVLSAAHCMTLDWYLWQSVYVGISHRPTWTDANNKYTIAEVHIHPGYRNEHVPEFDIVVLRLSRPLTYGPCVQPIGLAERPYPVGTHVLASGWGSTEYGKANIIRYVEMETVDPRQCNTTERTICTNDPDRSTCNGDSGGPLVADGVLIGLVSDGATMNVFNCTGYDRYASIYHLRGFIIEWATDDPLRSQIA